MGCFPITEQINECGTMVTNFDFEQEALVGNWDEIKTKTRNALNPLLINSLVMQSTKMMYPLIFREDKPMGTLAETTEEKSYAKPSKIEGELIVYGRTPEAAYTKFLLDNNKHFILLKQAAKKGTNAYYVLLGVESGLRPAAGENFVGDKGGYVHKFMADNLTYPQEFLYADAGQAATDANYAALQVAGV